MNRKEMSSLHMMTTSEHSLTNRTMRKLEGKLDLFTRSLIIALD